MQGMQMEGHSNQAASLLACVAADLGCSRRLQLLRPVDPAAQHGRSLCRFVRRRRRRPIVAIVRVRCCGGDFCGARLCPAQLCLLLLQGLFSERACIVSG